MATKLQSWFVNTNDHPYTKIRLFCFPYAGGGASIYREWSPFFSNDIGVCPVQLPGRESRGLEAPIYSLTQIVQSVAKEIQPLLNLPFVFFGHSMGALLAFETARHLERKYNKIPERLFVSGRPAPQLPHTGKSLYLLQDDEFKKELRLLKGTPEAILQHDELMELLLPRLRADFEVCETYTYSRDEPLACPITAFGGTADDVGIESIAAWKAQTRDDFDLHMFEGDHFFLHGEQEKVVKTVNEVMRKKAAIYNVRLQAAPAR